jgi:predicted  nucleic acid-binding Zn-ribbon protein
MKELLNEQQLDKIADELAELLTNTEKLDHLISQLGRKEADLVGFRERLARLENEFAKLSENLVTNSIEAERNTTEKIENLREEFEKQIENLEIEIQRTNEKMEKILQILKKS